MQGNVRAAGKIIGMAIFTSILCLFIQVSFHSMMKSFSTDVIGYEVYEVKEDEAGNVTQVSHGYIAKDEKPEEADSSMRYMSVYGEMPTSVKVVETVLSTVCSLGVLFCTTGTVFAKIAARDRNDCDFNGAVPDKARGLFIGALAAIPPFVFYLITLALRLFAKSSSVVNWYYWFYRFIIMGPVKPIVDLFTTVQTGEYVIASQTYPIMGVETDLASVPIWAIAVQGVFIILFIAFGYAMYRICYNEDSIISKLLYKSARDDRNVRRLGGR